MHVVIRVPWKRPASFPLSNQQSQSHSQSQSQASFSSNPTAVWTPEKDAQLWKLLSLCQPNEIDWDFIQTQMGISAEECFERSTCLYKQRLETIQRQMFEKKRDILLKSHFSNSTQPTSSSSSSSSHHHSKRTSTNQENKQNSQNEENIKNHSQMKASPRVKNSISKEQLYQLITKYDFDWVKIGKELGISPTLCRRMYLKHEKSNQQQSFSSSSMTQHLNEKFQFPKSPDLSRPVTPFLQDLDNIPAFSLSEENNNYERDSNILSSQTLSVENSSTSSSLHNIIENYFSNTSSSQNFVTSQDKTNLKEEKNDIKISSSSGEETLSSSTGSLTQSALVSAIMTMENDSQDSSDS